MPRTKLPERVPHRLAECTADPNFQAGKRLAEFAATFRSIGHMKHDCLAKHSGPGSRRAMPFSRSNVGRQRRRYLVIRELFRVKVQVFAQVHEIRFDDVSPVDECLATRRSCKQLASLSRPPQIAPTRSALRHQALSDLQAGADHEPEHRPGRREQRPGRQRVRRTPPASAAGSADSRRRLLAVNAAGVESQRAALEGVSGAAGVESWRRCTSIGSCFSAGSVSGSEKAMNSAEQHSTPLMIPSAQHRGASLGPITNGHGDHIGGGRNENDEGQLKG